MQYVFGDATLDPQRYELRRAGALVKLEPKVFEILVYLLSQRHRVVTRQELLEYVWPGQFLSDASLTARLMVARQAIGDSGRIRRLIRTVHGRGYRFVAPVDEVDEGAVAHPLPAVSVASATPAPRLLVADSPAAPPVRPILAPALIPESHASQFLDDTAQVGEYKLVTVLVGRLTGAQSLEPEALHRLHQAFARLILVQVQQYGGSVQQSLGDGVVALFGAPVMQEAHALRAVQTALGLRAGLQALHAASGVDHLSLALHLGLHTGSVIVGSLGPDGRLTVTEVGDTMHRAIALAQQASAGTILLSEVTAALVRGEVSLGAMGPAYRVMHSASWRVLPALEESRPLRRFVERKHELATLWTMLAHAAAGRGQVVSIVGEPGMGKTRLLYEFRHALRGCQVMWWAGRCLPYGQAIPYGPILPLLWNACGISETDGPEAITAKGRQWLQRCGIVPAEVGPYLLHLLGFPGGMAHLDTCNAEVHKARTLRTLQQLTITSSRPGPLILAVENLHWIDPFSAEYLRVLVEGLTGVPLLLLVTYRPGYRPPWMAHSYATQLVLSPLGPAGSREVIQGALGPTPVAEALVRAVLAKAEGNPFFLEELVQVLVEQGVQAAPHIPETVWAVLAERIDQLPPVAKWVLQVAAVIGRHVPEALLEALATGSKAALHEGLRALVSAELLCAMHRTSSLHYTFKHALTQEVVYQSLLQSTRQALHHRVVQVLAAQFPEIVETQPEVLTHHVTKAGMNGQPWPVGNAPPNKCSLVQRL